MRPGVTSVWFPWSIAMSAYDNGLCLVSGRPLPGGQPSPDVEFRARTVGRVTRDLRPYKAFVAPASVVLEGQCSDIGPAAQAGTRKEEQ
jgi:hypothetical protein